MKRREKIVGREKAREIRIKVQIEREEREKSTDQGN